MTVNNIRSPTQLFHGLHNPSDKENTPFVIIGTHILVDYPVGITLKIIIVVYKIDLHTSRLYRSDFNNKRMICIIDY